MERKEITINEIVLLNRTIDQTKRTTFFSGKNSKPINIFHMPNSCGKSLVFNALEHLFSNDTERFIKKTDKSIGVEIDFTIGDQSYFYSSDYETPFLLKTKAGESVENFIEILKGVSGLGIVDFEFQGKNRSSLKSLNRFVFLDFDGISDKKESNEISFIDARFDYGIKKLLLAYLLGAEIGEEKFRLIGEVEIRREFIRRNKRKYDSTIQEPKTGSLFKDTIKSTYSDLQNNRIRYGDLSAAIRELMKFSNEYSSKFGKDSDYELMCSELALMKIELYDCQAQIATQETIIDERIEAEVDALSHYDIGIRRSSKKEAELTRYKEYRKYLDGQDTMAVDRYIAEFLDPKINDFKNFIAELYNCYVRSAISGGLLNKEDIIGENCVQFNQDTLKIEAFFKTSEGMRESLRILTFIGLHIFSKKIGTRCIDISFYDSFLEKIDGRMRSVLFESVLSFSESENLTIPKMFFFVTKVEDGDKSGSLGRIAHAHGNHVNLIEGIGLKSVL